MGIDIEAIVNEANVDTASFDLAAVRALRNKCQESENAVSYARRIIQGRLDIVGCALTNCDGANMVAIDVPTLNTLLSDHTSPGAMPRPPQTIEPPVWAEELLEAVDSAIPPDQLAVINELPKAKLELLLNDGRSVEQQLSTSRRSLHQAIDRLQAELVQRYRANLGSVDELLQR